MTEGGTVKNIPSRATALQILHQERERQIKRDLANGGPYQGIDFVTDPTIAKLVDHLDEFPDLDQSIALQLIELGYAQSVLDNLDRFHDISHQIIANHIMEFVGNDTMIHNLHRFHGLQKKIFLHLWGVAQDNLRDQQETEELYGDQVYKDEESLIQNLSSFENPDDIISSLITSNHLASFLSAFPKFKTLNHQKIAQEIFAVNPKMLAENIQLFKDLDWSLGSKLFALHNPVDALQWENNAALGINPSTRLHIWDYFSPTQERIEAKEQNENVSYEDIAIRDLTYLCNDVDASDRFIESRFEVWKEMIGGFRAQIPFRQKFEEDLVREAIQSHPSTAKKFVQWFPQLPLLVRETPWLKAILIEAVAIVKKFDEARAKGAVVMADVPGMPEMYEDVAIDEKRLEVLYDIITAPGKDSQTLGYDLIRFRNDDAYEDSYDEHEMQAYLIAVDKMIREKNVADDETMKRAREYGKIIQDVLAGKKDFSSKLPALEIKCAVHAQEIEKVIMGLLHNLLARGKGATQEEMAAVLNQKGTKGGLRSFEKSLGDLLALYIAETWDDGGIRDEDAEEEIRELLRSAEEKYLGVYEVDIPLYDKLYKEFDEIRQSGRSTTEIFLGRDGIYAYFGRKAQAAARRKVSSMTKLFPQYLIYPRNFRDNVGKKVLAEFLQQEEVTTDVDPLFYDTGFSGSIPEQIMQIQGFTPEEIEKRIRLLSASVDHRRVKGIVAGARSDIVASIEANVKAENASFALIRDATSGKLRPISTPTSPRDRFLFAVVKQAIARHYWYKEMTQGEHVPYKEIAKETYTLHLLAGAVEGLDESFLDHADELINAGQVLKGNDGIVDGDVRRLWRANGKTLIAKAANMNRVAVDEHELKVLERAQRLGLFGVAPIGLLRLKGGVSWTLMEDVAGLSGRTIRQSLEKRRWTSDKIETLVTHGIFRLSLIADEYRSKMNIDKPWRLKDCMIQIDEESQTLVKIIPLDWERAEAFNPEKPHSVRER